MSQIAVFLAPGFEEIEALTVVDICRRAGLMVQTVAVLEKTEEKSDAMVSGSHGISVKADMFLADVDFEKQDMLVLPGGMPGTKNLEACERLMKETDAFYRAGKSIAAICAAPSIFGHRGYLTGRSACAYPGFEKELTGAEVTYHPVEVSGNVITSRGMGTAILFAFAIVEHFCGRECAENLAEAIVYQ